MIEPVRLVTSSPEQTQRLGLGLGELAQSGDIFLLRGSLGAGKTCFAQGIAWGLGIKEYVLSPSFIIVREYRGRLFLYHMDFYRLNSIEEVLDLGLDDYFYGQGVSVVEWADKGLGALPSECLLVTIAYISDTERSFLLEPKGGRYQEVLRRLRPNLQAA